jgi:hypothetical protein
LQAIGFAQESSKAAVQQGLKSNCCFINIVAKAMNQAATDLQKQMKSFKPEKFESTMDRMQDLLGLQKIICI